MADVGSVRRGSRFRHRHRRQGPDCRAWRTAWRRWGRSKLCSVVGEGTTIRGRAPRQAAQSLVEERSRRPTPRTAIRSRTPPSPGKLPHHTGRIVRVLVGLARSRAGGSRAGASRARPASVGWPPDRRSRAGARPSAPDPAAARERSPAKPRRSAASPPTTKPGVSSITLRAARRKDA